MLCMPRKRHALNRLAAHSLVLSAACALAIIEDGDAVDTPRNYDQQLSAHAERACLQGLDHGASKSPATSGCHESSENTEKEEEKERLRKQHDSEIARRPDVPAHTGRATADRVAGLTAPPTRSLLGSVVLRL